MDRKEENLNRDEQRIAELIGTLRHVDAPSDFEPRVHARIAERREARPRPFWLPALAGLAAVAILVFAGYIGLRSFNSGTAAPREIANTTTNAPAPVIQTQPSVAAPAPSVATQAPETVGSGKEQLKDNKIAQPAQQGGSFDEALKDAPHKFFVRKFDPSPRKANDTSGLGGQIPITMIFEAVGVHATWDGTGWRVDSVDSKNVAGRAGLKTGDVIEAINGQPVGEKTSFKGSFSGQSLRVHRDGNVIDIPFKP